MTLAALTVLVLQSSIAVVVFTVGLGTTAHELTYLFRRPGQLVRSLVSIDLVMPALAVAAALLLPLQGAVKVALVCLALSPVPPILPKKLIKAGGAHDYVMALLCTASVFAILWIPLVSGALDRIFPTDIRIPAMAVAKVVSMTVLGPTLAGVIVRRLAPQFAERAAAPLGKLATILLLAGFALMLAKAAPAMLGLLGDGTLLAIVGFLVLGLLTGHLLGGPSPGDRSALALATASRHPGVALAIAQITFPAEKAVLAALLLYLVVGMVVTLPYVRWRQKVLAGGSS
jgi:BASS family bile acid:Na+ symporter